MVSLPALLSHAAARLDDLLPLAGVPLVLGLLSVDNFRRVALEGQHFGVKFGLPIPVTTGWAFLSLPTRGEGVYLSPADPANFVSVAAVVAAWSAILGAGYLGSIHRHLAGAERAFVADVRRYALPLFGFQVLVFLGVAVVVGIAVVGVPFLLLGISGLLVAGYLLWATPYLVVAAGLDLREALSESYERAVAGGEYAAFFGQYLVAVAAISLVATPVFVNLGVAGGLAAVVVFAPVGLVFDTAAMAFVRALVDEGGFDG